MNDKQPDYLTILFVAIVVIMAMFPPWRYDERDGTSTDRGHAWIGSPPSGFGGMGGKIVIDFPRLLLQYFATFFVFGTIYLKRYLAANKPQT